MPDAHPVRERAHCEDRDRHQRQREQRVHTQGGARAPGQKRADHQELAVREVDDADHAHRQRQPRCDERVQAALQQAIEQGLPKEFHLGLTLLGQMFDQGRQKGFRCLQKGSMTYIRQDDFTVTAAVCLAAFQEGT